MFLPSLCEPNNVQTTEAKIQDEETAEADARLSAGKGGGLRAFGDPPPPHEDLDKGKRLLGRPGGRTGERNKTLSPGIVQIVHMSADYSLVKGCPPFIIPMFALSQSFLRVICDG